MTEHYYLIDGGHVLISGSTGARSDYGGKSVLANWWLDRLLAGNHRDMALYVNPKGHGFVRGNTCKTLSGLVQSYRAGNRHFDWQGNPGDGLEFCRHISDRTVIAADECQQYSGNEQLNWLLAQGGNLDSGSNRVLCITQRPWNLSETLRANMPVKIWVGPMTPEGSKFFQTESMGRWEDEVAEKTGPYYWAVTDAGELQHINPPVPEEFAQ